MTLLVLAFNEWPIYNFTGLQKRCGRDRRSCLKTSSQQEQRQSGQKLQLTNKTQLPGELNSTRLMTARLRYAWPIKSVTVGWTR